jgi:hypothetical protein
MDIQKNELKSKIVWDGVVLKKGWREEKVKLEGDKVEDTVADSFKEGVKKGIGVLLTGPAYPLIAGALKAYEGYTTTERIAEEFEKFVEELEKTDKWEKIKVGLKLEKTDKGEKIKAALKGALVGGTKGLVHGIIDFMVIGGLTAGAVVLTGPWGFLLTPVIGGVYNVVKDAIKSGFMFALIVLLLLAFAGDLSFQGN